jgi:signal peptidase I
MKQHASRALSIAAKLAVGGALVFCLGVFAFFGLGPHTGLYRTETVLSGSMAPHFSPGDVIIVTPEPLRDVRAGQVITYHAPVQGHMIVTHRVVKVLKGGAHPVIWTKGDANSAPDPWTARLQGTTAWQQRWVIPGAGFIIEWLRSQWMRYLLVFGVPLLLAFIWLRDIWGEDEEEEDEHEEVRTDAPALGTR